MKKTIFILTILLLIPALVLAQGKAQGQGNGVQQQLRDPLTEVTPQGNQYQNQNQVQNAGEETQVQYQAQEAQENEIKGGANRSDNAKAKMSAVAAKVQELLNDPTLEGGIGPQVRIIAQEQRQAQSEITGQLNKLESRQGLMKKLFGADQKATKNLKQQMEKNQLRITQLEKLQNQTMNQAEEAQIQELTQALVEQNTALQNKVQEEEQVGSVFGWLFRLFN